MTAKQLLFGEPAHALTRAALQNAASIASLILTMDCMIAQIPERRPAAPMTEEMA